MSKFINKSKQEKAQAKKQVLGQVIIEVYSDSTFQFMISPKISPEFIRARVNELKDIVNDQIVLNKMVELQKRATVLNSQGKPVLNISPGQKQ